MLRDTMRPVPHDKDAEGRVLAAWRIGVNLPGLVAEDFFVEDHRRAFLFGPRLLEARPASQAEMVLLGPDLQTLSRMRTRRALIQLLAQAHEEVYIKDLDLDDFIGGVANTLAFISASYQHERTRKA